MPELDCRDKDCPLHGDFRVRVSEPAESLGWHTISGEHLLEVLRRCENGESADLVYAELWANAEHEHVEGDEEGETG